MKVSTASIILASLLACSSAKRDHFDTIREVIGQREQVSKSIECEMDSDADSCAISDMDTSGTSTLVNPGGETRCIYSNTGPFKFQVWPGASDKLLFYFQGGGACWDKASTELGLCSTSASGDSNVGVFCRDGCSGENPFIDYTIVQVLYCSGDAHIGQVVRDYSAHDKNGENVSQQGAANVQATLDWVKAQDSYFTKFESLVLMGCSAGSLGVQAWAHEVLQQLGDKYGFKDAAVVPDSYSGVFPPDSQSQTIIDFGACDVSALDSAPELRDSCKSGTITLQEMTSYAAENNEDVPFAFLNSKEDEVQIAYYTAIAATIKNDTDVIEPKEYYKQVNEIFEGYSKYDNVVEFLISADQHCYTNNNHFWKADTTSSNGGGKDVTTMLDWLTTLPLKEGNEISTECDGNEIDDLDNRPTFGTGYCDTNIFNTISK
ncbi:hypothetical protein TrST_g5 [Triparma strigata]|uniref:Pectin acetylesterase n=1 Tax=Triparma strigata TaxID=1606541 RepID=A0A9W7ASF6_9STRA|nr:hypothetical protein TrST_g5 [Triparma strigata]